MSGGAIRIGTILGIPIRIHVTFLLVLPLLAFAFGRVFSEAARAADVPVRQLTGSPFLWGLLVALALFLSVLVHELAHSVYALRKGGRVRDITLLMIGGVSQIAEPPKRGRQEAVMALVGPVTSVALAGVFYLLYRAVGSGPYFNLKFVLFHLVYLNVVLGIFNLLPAFPMDGGRILRGMLAERWGLLRATRVAAGAGKAFAVLFAVVGFVSMNILLMVVAFFVYVGAEAENRGVLVKALLGHVRVRDLMGPRAAPVEPETSVFQVVERMLRERRLAFPVARGGEVLGVIALEDVRRVPSQDRERIPARQVTRRVTPVDVDDEAPRALRSLAEGGAAFVPVVEGPVVVGVLSQMDVVRGLQLTELEATQRSEAPRAARTRPGISRAEQHA